MWFATFLFGYILGSKAITKSKLIDLYTTIKTSRKQKTGVVRKLSPYEKSIKGTVQAETEKAVEETLDELL
jgi:hypothetical protein